MDARTARAVQSFIRLAAKQAYNKGGADDEATHALALFEHATNPNAPPAEREAASRDLNKLAREWMQGKRVLTRRSSKHSHPTKSPKPSASKRGRRFTDDEIYDAVARALADGVTSVGRPAEANRPAMGYDLWRESQPQGDKLPGGRSIRSGFNPPGGGKPRPGWKLRKGENAWDGVVRQGRKAGRIP